MGEAGSMTSFVSICVNLWFYSPYHGQLIEDLAYPGARSEEAPGQASADIPKTPPVIATRDDRASGRLQTIRGSRSSPAMPRHAPLNALIREIPWLRHKSTQFAKSWDGAAGKFSSGVLSVRGYRFGWWRYRSDPASFALPAGQHLAATNGLRRNGATHGA